VEFWMRFWMKGIKGDEILGFLSNCTPLGA
jgi:hypothetical protein